MTEAANTLETRFAPRGSLRPPGPFGRVARLVLGFLSLLPVISLGPQLESVVTLRSLPTHPSFWFGVAVGLWVFPYVVNIGFTRNWRARPRVVAVLVLGASVAVSPLVTGAAWSPVAGIAFYVFFLYPFGHLGLSFLLASAIATPGCEMRAVPHLWAVLTGRATKEHYCPGVLDPIDRWENRRRDAG